MIKPKILDFGVFTGFLLILLTTVLASTGANGGTHMVEIEASGEKFLMPLSKDASMTFTGPAGKTQVTISEGEAFISESDCRDKIGIAMGHISNPSSWVACLPNRVFVKITSSRAVKDEEPADAGAF